MARVKCYGHNACTTELGKSWILAFPTVMHPSVLWQWPPAVSREVRIVHCDPNFVRINQHLLPLKWMFCGMDQISHIIQINGARISELLL